MSGYNFRARTEKRVPEEDAAPQDYSPKGALSVPSSEVGSTIGAGEEEPSSEGKKNVIKSTSSKETWLKEGGSNDANNVSFPQKETSPIVTSKVSSDAVSPGSSSEKGVSTSENTGGRVNKKAGCSYVRVGWPEKLNGLKKFNVLTGATDGYVDSPDIESTYLVSQKEPSARNSKPVAKQAQSRKTPPRASTTRKMKKVVPVDLTDIDETVFQMKKEKYNANEINAAFEDVGHKFRSLRSYEHHWRKAKIAHGLGGSMPGGGRGRKAVRSPQVKVVRKAVPKMDPEEILFLRVMETAQAAFGGIFQATAKTLSTLFAAGVTGSVGRSYITPIIEKADQSLWEHVVVQFAQVSGNKQFSADECKLLLKKLRPDDFEKWDLGRVEVEPEDENEVPEEFRIPQLVLLEVDEEWDESEDIWGVSDSEEDEGDRSSDGEFNPVSRKSKSGAKGNRQKSQMR